MKNNSVYTVLMEHPPKQGLKLVHGHEFGGVSTVLMEHPPKQGLKHNIPKFNFQKGFEF